MVVVVLGWGLVEGNEGMGWMSAVGWDGTGDWETGIGVLGYGDVGWRGSGNLDDPRTPMEIRLCDNFEDLYRSLQSVCVYHRRSRQVQLLPRRRANKEGSSLGRLTARAEPVPSSVSLEKLSCHSKPDIQVFVAFSIHWTSKIS